MCIFIALSVTESTKNIIVTKKSTGSENYEIKNTGRTIVIKLNLLRKPLCMHYTLEHI